MREFRQDLIKNIEERGGKLTSRQMLALVDILEDEFEKYDEALLTLAKCIDSIESYEMCTKDFESRESLIKRILKL